MLQSIISRAPGGFIHSGGQLRGTLPSLGPVAADDGVVGARPDRHPLHELQLCLRVRREPVHRHHHRYTVLAGVLDLKDGSCVEFRDESIPGESQITIPVMAELDHC